MQNNKGIKVEFSIHPNVYKTNRLSGLREMLEELWIKDHINGQGTIYIISGFANFNGGARFYKTFKEHTEKGGRIVVFLGGSSSQRLSSKQVARALVSCGAEVNIINRKRLLHAKCYGVSYNQIQNAVISSGNFTGPGLSLNVEASVYLRQEDLHEKNFYWEEVEREIKRQQWQTLECDSEETNPAWNLLYDETPGIVEIDESEEETLIITLMPTDTNRILANKDDVKGKGSQYFWLSKDCFDFFPPLTIKNARGWKGTLSAMITLNYVDLNLIREERVTFEAENNLDFRLGTGGLRYTKLAKPNDLACITRKSDDKYELRIISQDDDRYRALEAYAQTFIGHQGKRYGFIDNKSFYKLVS